MCRVYLVKGNTEITNIEEGRGKNEAAGGEVEEDKWVRVRYIEKTCWHRLFTCRTYLVKGDAEITSNGK